MVTRRVTELDCDPPFFGAGCQHGRGIGFAFTTGMKLLLASIALSALVLWALGCGGIGG